MATQVRPPYPHDLGRVSYAQNAEDILIDRLFRGEVGTFVDIGACHPVIHSNTAFFHERGWRGVNLEPSAVAFQFFVDHRPLDRNLNLAASDFDGELTYYEIADHVIHGISTLSAEIARGYARRGYAVVEKPVAVRTVRGLVQEYDIDPPDFLSIDVESHEAQVIRGIDLEHWRPKLIVVESTVPLSPEPNHQTWEPRLLEQGYRFMAFNGLNPFYLRDDLPHLARHFETPVNGFDSFVTHAVVRADAATAELRRELDLARLVLKHEDSERQRFQRAISELARREACLEDRWRHLEFQRDKLVAKLDHCVNEVEALRSELARLRLVKP
jgi:FkbM family methyltransferase